MNTGESDTGESARGESSEAPPVRQLTPAARRALAEAEARRAAAPRVEAEPEVAGRGGLDPARYGDWEVKGIATDF